MKRTIHFRRIAEAEFDAAVEWYEQARPGLGFRFLKVVHNLLSQISKTPKTFPLVEADAREAPVSGFPYCLYYRVRTDRLVVIAVYHQSRDPEGWKDRH